MPDPCALGAENRQAITDNRNRLNRHDVTLHDIYNLVDNVRNRLPIWAVIIIAGLSSLATALITAAVAATR